MIYLLDVNALVALGFSGHEFHGRVARWAMGLDSPEPKLATCPLTEIGFARILSQTAAYGFAVADAKLLLQEVKRTFPVPFAWISDDLGISELPQWVQAPGQIGDGHLLQLAKAHGAELATLDRGIPGALLIPLQA